jgi:serine protease AprX
MSAVRERIPRARLALLAIVAAGLAAAVPAQAAGRSGASTALLELAATHPDRSVDAIVRLSDGSSPAAGRALIRSHGGRVTGDLHIIDGLAARLTARDAARLARDRTIEGVSVNAPVAPQSVATNNIRTAYPFASSAPSVWNGTGGTPSATGRGVGVAVIDTGIDGSLPDFRTSVADSTSRVVGSAVVNPNATTAGDRYGHGTHVAGILAGNGGNRTSNDWLDGQYVGIAPEANLISVKVSNGEGEATVLDVIYGLQFVVDHRAEYNIRVVNLSLESTEPQSAGTDPLDAAAEAAWFDGIVVVAAVGNRGTANDAVSRAPGNDPYVISVGALDDMTTRGRDDDVVASWSSRGTTQDGHAKPEIYASGAHITSTLAPGSSFASLCPECVISGAYFRAGGTSMSAPVVSGVAALVLERRPDMTPDQVKSLIMRSARALPSGLPAVDAGAAVRNSTATTLPSANAGLTPNELIDTATGGIDYSRSSWSRSSWSTSSGGLSAGWARSSWSCNCSLTETGQIDPTRSSWSRSSWSTSWSK